MWYPLSLGNPAPDDPDDPVLQAQWILAFQSFLTLGELIGFSEHGMERIGITRPARAIFVKGLQRAGVLVVVPRSGTYYGTRPDGRPWHPQAVRRELRAGRLSLPHPVGVSPPPVWNAAVGQIGQGRIQPGRLADTKSTTKGTTK